MFSFFLRDRYFATHFPRGPKDGDQNLPVDWYRGEMSLFLSRYGNPLNTVNLDHFSEVCGIDKVKPGDFRKIHSTSLAHHPKRVYCSVPQKQRLLSQTSLSSSRSFVTVSQGCVDTQRKCSENIMTRRLCSTRKRLSWLFRKLQIP